MGEAKRRGTPEQRQAEGKAKAQALAEQKADMSTEQHKALKYAEILEGNARSGTVTVSDDERKTAAMLRTMHALIVQMAEALSVALPDLSGAYLLQARTANAAATQYLTRGPKT